ncbi:hypothetical protein K8B33_05140 [Alcanivorax sp. JB21]|uniref:hypothetical protein n=1 Tax=Alcanivorax limicola TaxID=2874102 RepID=UPI001CBC2AA6|nr:hypothetical protein [Alcanivorax limicola]MBZ2188469.1 hypothetical protein [Alcanivorax limicola]
MMSSVWLVAGSGLVLIGLTGFLLTPDLLRRLLAFHITGSGALLLVLALAGADASGDKSIVPALLVFTGMLVGLAATLLALWLLRRARQLALHRAAHTDADPGS